MKIYKTQLSLITMVYLPLFAIYLFVYLFMKQELIGFKLVHWVFLALGIFLLVSPQRKDSFSTDKKKHAFPLWVIYITGFVGLLNSFFYFGHSFLNSVMMINKPIDLPHSISISTGGLFPWALVALFAITLQRTYFNNNTSGLISDCLIPIFNTSQHSEIGKYCNTYLRITIFFSLLLLLFFTGSVILYLCQQTINLPLPTGITIQNLLATSVFFYIINFSRWQFFFNWLIKIGCPTLIGMLLLLCSAMGLLVSLIAGANSLPLSFVVHYYPFDPSVWNIVLEMLNVFIALSWVPLASSTIAILSRGYRANQIIIVTLLIPVLTQYFTPPEITIEKFPVALLLLCCSILLLIIFTRDSLIATVSRGLFPTAFPINQSKPLFYLRSLLVTAAAFISIFWVTGIYLIALLVSAFTITSALLIMISVVNSQANALSSNLNND